MEAIKILFLIFLMKNLLCKIVKNNMMFKILFIKIKRNSLFLGPIFIRNLMFNQNYFLLIRMLANKK
jgi:hypothetical protein